MLPPSLHHNQLNRTAVSNPGQWCNYRFALYLDLFLITLITIYGPTDTALSTHSLTLHYLITLRAFSHVSSHYLHILASYPSRTERHSGWTFRGKHFVLCNKSTLNSFSHYCEWKTLAAICMAYRALLMLRCVTTLHHHSAMNGLWIIWFVSNDIFMQQLIFFILSYSNSLDKTWTTWMTL